MSLRLYMDVHVPYPITLQLRLRGVVVVTAQEDGAGELKDPALLDRATSLGCVLFTQDIDLIREARRRQKTGEPFGGVIYAHQLRSTIGQCIEDLELFAKATNPAEWANRLEYLPLG